VAQINLLKQTESNQHSWDIVPKIFARLFLFILVLLVLYYGWTVVSYGQVESQIAKTQTQINNDRAAAMSLADRNEVLTRQLQLQTQASLISNHIYFSQLFPELARVTLKTASYSSLQAVSDGTMTLTATVPTVDDLDKYLQIFDLPAFNQNFSDIKIGGFHKTVSPTGGNTALNFSVRMQYNPALIKYKNPSQ
jgi:hypothetical protein